MSRIDEVDEHIAQVCQRRVTVALGRQVHPVVRCTVAQLVQDLDHRLLGVVERNLLYHQRGSPFARVECGDRGVRQVLIRLAKIDKRLTGRTNLRVLDEQVPRRLQLPHLATGPAGPRGRVVRLRLLRRAGCSPVQAAAGGARPRGRGLPGAKQLRALKAGDGGVAPRRGALRAVGWVGGALEGDTLLETGLRWFEPSDALVAVPAGHDAWGVELGELGPAPGGGTPNAPTASRNMPASARRSAAAGNPELAA
eukprot:CAMPEP_0170215404 /NCGR_PEP_ID=MMETSP0116_2-20130129/7338_1 /TAXON_ID=400756 /ORGANISM="Durinskia baltica, Strain CSIRO CS-38" /LENGTH=252 /DNA_ID=CAMNT_0010465979 /DNA_START=239 /DNA_END=994 /DNA_ORIENTATION=-